MEGWIKLHRCMCDWQHYQEPSVMMVFIDLLLHANTKDGYYRGVLVKTGESARSLRAISQSVGLAVNTVRTALDKLVKSGEIKRRSFKFGMITTINNFDNYQYSVSTNDTPKNTVVDTALDTPVDTKQEGKNNIYNTLSPKRAHAHTHEGLVVEILEQTSTLEQFCMQNHISVQEFADAANEVVTEWELTDVTHRDRSDAKRHLFSVVRLKLKDKNKRNGNNRSTYEEQRDKLYAGSAAIIARLAAEDDARAAKVRNS